jgi:hypothetical protein
MGGRRRDRARRRARVCGAWRGLFAISTFGFLDLAILAPTRVYYAMAADGTFLPALATLHPTYRTPALAIGIQTAWACLLELTGEYGREGEHVDLALLLPSAQKHRTWVVDRGEAGRRRAFTARGIVSVHRRTRAGE